MSTTEPVTRNIFGTKVYKSRWGYYPCDYQEYRELKEVHRKMLDYLRMVMRHQRWIRKQPENRRGAEPPLTPMLSEYLKRGTHFTFKTNYEMVLSRYVGARYPKGTMDEVRSLEPTWRIWQLRIQEDQESSA